MASIVVVTPLKVTTRSAVLLLQKLVGSEIDGDAMERVSKYNRSLKEDVILAPAAVVSVTVTRAGQFKNISAKACPAIVEIVTVSRTVQPPN